MSVSSKLTDNVVGLKTIINSVGGDIVSPDSLNDNDVITENSDGSITFTKGTTDPSGKIHMYFHSTSSSLDNSVSADDVTFNNYEKLKYSFFSVKDISGHKSSIFFNINTIIDIENGEATRDSFYNRQFTSKAYPLESTTDLTTETVVVSRKLDLSANDLAVIAELKSNIPHYSNFSDSRFVFVNSEDISRNDFNKTGNSTDQPTSNLFMGLCALSSDSAKNTDFTITGVGIKIDAKMKYYCVARPLKNVIANLWHTKNSTTFLTSEDKFNINYDLTTHVNSSNEVISYSDPSRSDILQAATQAGLLSGRYGLISNIQNTATSYLDPEHYCLEILEDTSSQIFFDSSMIEVSGNVDWRLTYCDKPGNLTTRNGTILYGTKTNTNGNILLTVNETGIDGISYNLEHPVNGMSALSIGTYISLTNETDEVFNNFASLGEFIGVPMVQDTSSTMLYINDLNNNSTQGTFDSKTLVVDGETYTGKLCINNDSWTSLTFNNCVFDASEKHYCVYIKNPSTTSIKDIKNITFNGCTFTNAKKGTNKKKYAYGLLIDNKPGAAEYKYPTSNEYDIHDITVTDCTFTNLGKVATKIAAYGINIQEVRGGGTGDISSANITITNNIFNNIAITETSGNIIDKLNGVYFGTAIKLAKEYFSSSEAENAPFISKLKGVTITNNNITFVSTSSSKHARQIALELQNVQLYSGSAGDNSVIFDSNSQGEVYHYGIYETLKSVTMATETNLWVDISGVSTSNKTLNLDNFYRNGSTASNSYIALAAPLSANVALNAISQSREILFDSSTETDEIDKLSGNDASLNSTAIGEQITSMTSTTTMDELATSLGLTDDSSTKEAVDRKARRKTMKVLLNNLKRKQNAKIKITASTFKKFINIPSTVKLTKDLIVVTAQKSVDLSLTPNDTNTSYVILPIGDEITMTIGSYTLKITETEDASGSLYNGTYIYNGETTTVTNKRDEDVLVLGSYRILFGSITVGETPDSSSGSGIGDPYITTLYGKTYKMADFTGNMRLLQGKYNGELFTMNAETKLLSKEEIKDLLHYRQDALNNNNMRFSETYRFGKFPAYFSKLYVSHGKNYFIADINSLKIIESNYPVNVAHSIELNKGYEWCDVPKASSRIDITIGDINLSLMSYADKDIRNGFRIYNCDLIENRSGSLENTIYTKDAKLRSLNSIKSIKQRENRKHKRISKEEMIESGKREQYKFEVY